MIEPMSPEYIENMVSAGAMLHLHWRELTPNPLNELVRGGQANAETSLAELSASIEEHGVIQPLLIQKTSNGWMILAGERRWRATQALGNDAPLLPCIIRHTDNDLDSLVEMGIENLQREDLDPITEARYYAALLERGLDKAGICRQIGVKLTRVTDRLELLDLAPTVQQHIQAKRLPITAAKHLRPLDQVTQTTLANKLQGRNGKEIERAVMLVRKRLAKLPSTGSSSDTLPELAEGRPKEEGLTDTQKLAALRTLTAALVAQLRLDAVLLAGAAADLADIGHPAAEEYQRRADHITNAIKGAINR